MFKPPTIVLEKDSEKNVYITFQKEKGKLYKNLKKILLKRVYIGTAPRRKGWVRGKKNVLVTVKLDSTPNLSFLGDLEVP